VAAVTVVSVRRTNDEAAYHVSMSRGTGRGAALEDFAGALRLEAHNLARWPGLLPQQLFNQLRHGSNPVFAEDDPEERPPFATRTWILDRAPPQETVLRLTLSGHADKVSCCAVAPGNSLILSGSKDTTLKVWDAETGKELYTLSGHTEAVNDCAIFPDGRTAVSAGEDGTLRVWDLQAGREQSQRRGDELAVACCGVAPDGSFIVSGGNDGDAEDLGPADLGSAQDPPRA
jgi:hypothetical protein